ncbi:MAG: M24 family metallopeptidase [Nitriliruptorales bacterium]|nr:M24 family metallopeptidase [Nitriliruptorales bacterium]
MSARERRERLRARLRKRGLDALLVTRRVNIRYLTGFTGSAGTLLVTADGGADLFVSDGRYSEQAAAEVPDLERGTSRGTGWLADRLGDRGVLGLESHAVSWDRVRALEDDLPGVRVVPAPRHVEELRQVKDAGELELLAQACALGDAAFAGVLEWLAPGVTERQVARRLERDLVDRGAEEVAFPPIVASGPNSARPHHRPGDRPLARGDLVVMDFGARVGGYCGDMTRTIAVGPPPQELRAVHDLVLAAEREGVRAAVDGAPVKAVDATCRDIITAGGRGESFVHPTGHALGLEIHEDPILRGDAAGTLRAGMAVTVEPGVYLPGLGGVRIEDTVAVRPPTPHDPAPPEVLTRAPRELFILPAAGQPSPGPNS